MKGGVIGERGGGHAFCRAPLHQRLWVREVVREVERSAMCPARSRPPVSPPPCTPPPPGPFGSLRSIDGSLLSTQGPAPAPPLNNKTPAMAIDRLVYAPPCVCTALCMHRQTFPSANCARKTARFAQRGHTPLNNKTPAMATDRLVCAPLCVWNAKPSLPYPPPPVAPG